MSSHPLPNPQKLRQIPPQFSWIDHRLVRDGHFEQCSCEALALYLFLLTVADHKGLSYYSQPSLMKQLTLGMLRFTQARAELIQAGLMTYKHPLYQVLALDPRPVETIAQTGTKHRSNAQQLSQIKRLLNAKEQRTQG